MCHVYGCRNKQAKKGRFCTKHIRQKWVARNPINAAYVNLRSNARRRGKVFTLTLEEFTSFVTRTAYLDHKGRTRYCMQIDRIDHTKGYTADNIQPLSCGENALKGNREKYAKAHLRELAAGQMECPF